MDCLWLTDEYYVMKNQTFLCEVPVFHILMVGDVVSSKKKTKLYLVKYSKRDWSINSLLCIKHFVFAL